MTYQEPFGSERDEDEVNYKRVLMFQIQAVQRVIKNKH